MFYLSFILIIKYVGICNENDYEVKKVLLENQFPSKNIESDLYSKNIIKSKINSSLKNKGYNLINVSADIDNEWVKVSSKFRYKLPLYYRNGGYIKNEQISQIRQIKNGESVCDYSICMQSKDVDFDVWAYKNLKRGTTIANILGNNLGFEGNKIDMIQDRRIISIVSMDIRKETYNNYNKISDVLMREIDILANFTEYESKIVKISKNDYDSKLINIVIPTSELTQIQQIEFMKIRRYCKNKGINCVFTALREVK